MPDGEERLKRLMYLSELRNRSLRPLDKRGPVSYDRVLFLNDVFFDPVDALQLLFSTNLGPDGRAGYVATCALDFHDNPFKFYDLFATRDLEGYSMGVPFFPFFSSAGAAVSRHDILAQKDAVRVKSCWSGMAAFDAKYIQPQSSADHAGGDKIGYANVDPTDPRPASAPARFRAEPEIFFDACECCLLMADTLKVAQGTTDISTDGGIYVNPYVRVAYSESVLWKLKYSRRIERLYSPLQWLVNSLAGMPTYNPHREVLEGQQFQEEVWRPDLQSPAGGDWEMRNRTARNGMYCGVREMQLITQGERSWESNWENVMIPDGRSLF